MREIDVFGTIYTISENCTMDDDGDCCPDSHEIRLNKSIRDRETLLHEIGHAILFEGGLYTALDEKLREVIVQQFGQVIAKNFYIRFK